MKRITIAAVACVGMVSSVGLSQIVPKSDLSRADITINERLTPTDVKHIVEIVKFNREHLGRSPSDAPGIDVDKREVKITNDDLGRRDRYIEQSMLGEGKYARFRMFCESKLKFVVDEAVFRGVTDLGPIADFTSDVIGGLYDACGNPPNAANKAFIQKIKTIHFALDGIKCTTHPYAKDWASYSYAFDAKSGEMTVGVCSFNPNNIDRSVKNWVALQ